MSDVGAIDIGAAIEGQPRTRFAAGLLALCCAIMVVEGYDNQVLAYAAPAIIRDWHVKKAVFGPVFSAALFGYMVGALTLSSLSDRIGRKRIIVVGALLFGVLTVATAFARSIDTLMMLRFLAGVGLGCSIPSAIALGVEYAPRGQRALRVSLMFIGYTLGAAFGGVLAAWLIVRFGWQGAFYLGGFASLALGAVLIAALPESLRFMSLKAGGERAIASVMRRLRPDLAIPDGSRFVLHEETHVGPPVANLFTGGRAALTLLLWLAFVTSLMAHYFLTSWLPTVLDGAGVPLAHAVVAGSLLQAGGAAGSLLVGGQMDRRGVIAVAASYVLAIPFVLAIGAVGMPEVLLMLVVFMAGLFLLGGQIALNALAGTIYPTFIRSTGTGWALGVGRFGSILGPLLGGILIGMKLSLPMLFVCAAIPVAACAVAVLLLRRSTGGTARPAPIVLPTIQEA